MAPTIEEIEKTIKALKEIKPKVRRRTFFCDDNHAAIQAQITVLERRMDEDDIFDRWPDDEEDEHERSAALEAWAYLNGEPLDGDGLVEDWAALVEGD